MGKKITKRERKALRGPNYAVRQSLKHGYIHEVGGTEYMGDTPVFRVDNHGIASKIRPGTPFVRSA